MDLYSRQSLAHLSGVGSRPSRDTDPLLPKPEVQDPASCQVAAQICLLGLPVTMRAAPQRSPPHVGPSPHAFEPCFSVPVSQAFFRTLIHA